MSDTMKALADRLEAHLEKLANTPSALSMMDYDPIANDILLAARTLRAALTAPADDEIEAIRNELARRAAVDDDGDIWERQWAERWLWDNRATLLRALDAERQRRVEVGKLLDDLREVAKAITNGAQDTLWMGDGIADPTIVDFICGITGDDPSFIGSWERAALNQEPGQ